MLGGSVRTLKVLAVGFTFKCVYGKEEGISVIKLGGPYGPQKYFTSIPKRVPVKVKVCVMPRK